MDYSESQVFFADFQKKPCIPGKWVVFCYGYGVNVNPQTGGTER
jgi:hypothetical protein